MTGNCSEQVWDEVRCGAIWYALTTLKSTAIKEVLDARLAVLDDRFIYLNQIRQTLNDKGL